MNTDSHPTLAELRTAARRRFGGSATPFRCGLVLGASVHALANPYPAESRAAACFDKGFIAGRWPNRKARR